MLYTYIYIEIFIYGSSFLKYVLFLFLFFLFYLVFFIIQAHLIIFLQGAV